MKIYLYLLSLLLGSCTIEAGPDHKLIDLRVNHYKHTAAALDPVMVMLVQEKNRIGNDQWQYHYDEIEGFTFEMGYVYDLKVRKVKIINPPADASSFVYRLHRIQRKQQVPAGEQFQILLQRSFGEAGAESYITGSPVDGFYILDEIKIECGALCDELEEKLESGDEITGVFEHIDNFNHRLVGIIP